MQILTLPLANCVNLGQLLNWPEPSFPDLEKRKILTLSPKVGLCPPVTGMANCPPRLRLSPPQDGVTPGSDTLPRFPFQPGRATSLTLTRGT